MKRIIITVFLVGLLIAAGIGFYMYNKPHRSVEAEEASISLTASQLFNTYSDNEKQADSMYLNKIVVVSGVISDIEKDQKGESVLIIKEEDDIFGVVCSLDESDMENHKKAATLKSGDSVKVKGICTGFAVEVKLNKCVLVK